MKKLLFILLTTILLTKLNAQCLIPVNSVSENFNTPPPTCWYPIGAAYGSGAVILSTYATGGSRTIILPMTDNAKGILEFDIKNTTNSNPTIQLLIGTVSNQSAGAMSSFELIKSHPVPMAQSGGVIVYAHHVVDLSTYAGSQQFIALSISQSALNPYLYIDNLTYQSACISSSVNASAQNYTVQLNNTGQAQISTSNINNGSSSGCGTPSLSLSKSFFDCSNIGVNSVTLSATDNSGNTSTTTANVTILPAINDEALSASQNTICSGKNATITTASSVAGIKYNLRNDATNAIVVGPITGTGNSLSFNTGSLTANTSFNVYAETNPIYYGLDFDGTNDVINTNILPAATNSLTIETWVYPRATVYKRIVSCYNGSTSTSGEYILDTYNATNNGRGLRFVVEGASNTLHQLSAANVLTLNVWNHVAATFENGVVKIYVNGLAVGTSTAPFTSLPACTNNVTIGEDPTVGTAEYFNGKMDDIRIWNTARTAAQISGNMNNCLVGNESGLKAYFKLSEGSGNTITDLKIGSIGTMSGMDPATDWVIGKVDCGEAVCTQEMSQIITINVSSLPTLNVVSSNTLLCAGETVTLTASGASTYTWSTSQNTANIAVTPTANTSYTVTGTSAAGCVSSTYATSSVTVNALPVISVNNGSICAGGSFTMVPSGANTYTFQGGSAVVSPTTTGSYTVVGMDASGCVSNPAAVSTITVNSIPVISVAGGAICPGNSFTLNPTGASTYTYSSGSPVVSPSSTTSYTISGSSASGCQSNASAVATVSVSGTLTITITGNNTVCSGQAVSLTAGGATTYTWNTGATSVTIAPTPTANATYSVIGASGSCSNTALTSITVNSLPNVSATTNNTLICSGQTATLTANGASTYTWSTSENTANIAIAPTVQTTYTVEGTGSNGCINTSVITQSVTVCTDVNTLLNQTNQISVYPNPFNNKVIVTAMNDFSETKSNIQVYNALGSLVYSTEIKNENTELDLHDQALGIYFINVTINGMTSVHKIVKQ